jgi:hypothetical protein
MPATVIINRWTGSSGSPTYTDITSKNTVANAVDSHQGTASTSTNPIRIPSSGTNYSFWVVTRLQATAAPAGTIDNIKWYTDGSNNFTTPGVDCIGNTATTYVQALGTTGTTGLALGTTNYTTLTGTAANVFSSFTSGSPKSVTGSIVGTTGHFGDLFVYQITVGTNATPGTTAQETFTWSYDET